MDELKAGQTWRHYKGGKYEIVALGRDEPTLEPVVIYRSRKDSSVWVRSIVDFLAIVGSGHRFTLERE